MAALTAIELLQQVAVHPDCDKMNRSTVKGFLGELLVKLRLEQEGMTVTHLGNQKGYDLQFVNGESSICVDVKMSLPKDEFRWGFEYWGWALQPVSKKVISATHFVCVGCTADLEVDTLFVVRKEDVGQFPAGERQFKGVLHGLILPIDPQQSPPQITSNAFDTSRRLLQAGVVRQVPLNGSLVAALA